MTISFIGSAGIPNRYGGFESFLEHCAPVMAAGGEHVIVTCDARLYLDRTVNYRGVERGFISIPANGAPSIIHDALAFARVFGKSNQIVILGVSGGIWFPFFRLFCSLTGKRLIVNIDGVEWRRTKFSKPKRAVLRAFDWLAQRFSHHVIYDSAGLQGFLIPSARLKSSCIAYPGDHVKRLPSAKQIAGSALTVCRIEPENNLELLIDGFLKSSLHSYTIVGNWQNSDYARALRKRYANEPRLTLKDPIYDADQLAALRESCACYLHGHSVGGTNPSLVEMLFYDCRILCFDVPFNRFTADDSAEYFCSSPQLTEILDQDHTPQLDSREELRARYGAAQIAREYVNACRH